MAKNGKRRTGRPLSPPRRKAEEDPFENLPAKPLPPPPVEVAEPKFPKLARARRSPLSVAFRHITPDWRRYIQYVDLAARKGDEAMARFRDCYEALTPIDKLHCWPEQICDLARVTPGELVGAVCRAIWENKAAESSMVSSIAHPELLLHTIKFAKKEENYRDRELYFTMMGSLPNRKGASINIFNAAAGQIGDGKLPDLAQGRSKLRSFDEEVIEMSRDLEAPFLVKDDVPPEDH
jgi:hypothetical protein